MFYGGNKWGASCTPGINTVHSFIIFIERLNGRSNPYSLPRKIDEQGCFFSAAPGVIFPQSSLQQFEFQGLI